MELGDVNSGESSKNQQVEIQVEGKIQIPYNKCKIDLQSFHSDHKNFPWVGDEEFFW